MASLDPRDRERDPDPRAALAARCAPRGAAVGLAELHARLDAEIVDALRAGRDLAVLVVDLGAARSSMAAGAGEIAAVIAATARGTDTVGFRGDAEVLVLLPGARDAAAPAARILGALAPTGKAGFARCPDDGCDADTLLDGAREAARHAAPGQLASVADASRSFTFAGRTAVVADPAMKRLFGLIERLSASDLPVLVNGETGVGKEIAAAAIHAWSPRRGGRMVAINCAALPDTLLESELFGHERGAFSGADTARAGHLELASGGTVFLDEISECSPRAQAKLLRALETRRITRLGSSVERAVDIRVVAAANRALEDEVAAGRFRQDLVYRLAAATVVVPPLRARPLDLPLLARLFLAEARARVGRPALAISPGAMHGLARHAWPGNVRELRNVMEYLAATVDEGEVAKEHLPDRGPARAFAPARDAPALPRAFRNLDDEIRELERLRMSEALETTGGVQTEAAALIGMPLRTFVTKRKKYGLAPSPARHARSVA